MMARMRCFECGLKLPPNKNPDNNGFYKCPFCGLEFREKDHDLINTLDGIDGIENNLR